MQIPSHPWCDGFLSNPPLPVEATTNLHIAAGQLKLQIECFNVASLKQLLEVDYEFRCHNAVTISLSIGDQRSI
ncbi:hypothetical protein [Marinomonas rhizomae]|uniref:Uncharacterized protein n=1 Tax=Marinomonas rhizomae TaxID=491948 RepID=A0A366IXY7_9GAMM|nr:hypothetical protein [Marinomonas rhizomae]RBP79040.1 hypothetical protein DFP80_11666 [Marinomonas rhizomae]